MIRPLVPILDSSLTLSTLRDFNAGSFPKFGGKGVEMLESSMNIGLFSLPFLLITGLSLGGVYFGGLWMTLRRLPRQRRPFLSMGLSWCLRLAVLLGGGAWLLQHSIAPPLQTILLISIGVWLSRMLLIARLLKMVQQPTPTGCVPR